MLCKSSRATRHLGGSFSALHIERGAKRLFLLFFAFAIMSVTYPPPAAVNRNSHFREAFMEEYTIASSTRDETSAPETSLGRRLRDFGRTQIDGSSQNVKIWSRIINGLTHLAFSFVLLAIMIEFMVRYRGRSRWWVSFTFNPDFIHLGARAGILFFCWYSWFPPNSASP